VELAKQALGYRAATGDLFALVAPLGIAIGRVGCLLHGCCLGERCAPAWYTLRDAQGVARWPAVPVELAFNILALVIFLLLRRRGAMGGCAALRGQHFHLYLIGYGAFRFAHEWLRVTPKIAGVISGYQLAALACVALGAWGFHMRARSEPIAVAA
jgi:phosphatidylglycerol:prolipoprotein diacylglycerol transferase